MSQQIILRYFPCYDMTNYDRRAFSYIYPHACNLLPENVWKSTSTDIFKRSLKTFLFEQITHSAHQRWFFINGLYKVYFLILIVSLIVSSLHKSIGDRAFPVAAAKVWNMLPSAITSLSSLEAFKRALKTELFRRSYGNAHHRQQYHWHLWNTWHTAALKFL